MIVCNVTPWGGSKVHWSATRPFSGDGKNIIRKDASSREGGDGRISKDSAAEAAETQVSASPAWIDPTLSVSGE
jgi:hypothetical protein